MYLGIDIGGTSIKMAVLTEENQLIGKLSQQTDTFDLPEDLMNFVLDVVNSYLEKYPNIKSLGIGIPGVVNNDGKVIVAPNLHKWINIEFGKFLSQFVKIPFALDNDANAASLAELYLGAGKDTDSFLYVTLGTGVGGAIIFNRKLFRGTIGGAAEFGHIIINSEDNRQITSDYRTGTLESYIGRNAILKNAADKLTLYPDSLLAGIDFDVFHIAKFAAQGDLLSIDIIKDMGFKLGIALSSIMNILDIPVAIIGGGISQAGKLLFDEIENTIKKRSLASIAERAKIMEAEYLNDTGLIGAALLGKSKFI